MDSFTLPLKLVCTVSGKEVTYTSAEYVRKKLEKFGGSLERLRKEFVCRAAKQTTKKSKSYIPSKPVGVSISVGLEELSQPIGREYKIEQPRPATKKDLPNDVCYNPGFFVNHGKRCDGCTFADICNYSKQRFQTA